MSTSSCWSRFAALAAVALLGRFSNAGEDFGFTPSGSGTVLGFVYLDRDGSLDIVRAIPSLPESGLGSFPAPVAPYSRRWSTRPENVRFTRGFIRGLSICRGHQYGGRFPHRSGLSAAGGGAPAG